MYGFTCIVLVETLGDTVSSRLLNRSRVTGRVHNGQMQDIHLDESPVHHGLVP